LNQTLSLARRRLVEIVAQCRQVVAELLKARNRQPGGLEKIAARASDLLARGLAAIRGNIDVALNIV